MKGRKARLSIKGRELLEAAGIDPLHAGPEDIRLANCAAAKGPETFERCKKHLEQIEVFGDFKTAIIAAGVI